ncbi:MAG: Uma2 family endonuclease [Blastocatellia bacterium]|nr:Uma2 family endonuclease [Blastocatellia bacterium]
MNQPSSLDFKVNIDHIITEDDTPVDNLPSEKQQRLLTEPLHANWSGPGAGRSYLVAANVGIFYMTKAAPIVPDAFLSLDVEIAEDWWEKENRSYFIWEFGKSPEVAIEVVSNRVGGEADAKKAKYARIKVEWYVVFDPLRQVMEDVLTVFKLKDGAYELHASASVESDWYCLLPSVPLGLKLWEGEYETKQALWLRWTDVEGNLIPTGKESTLAEREAKEREREAKEREREAKEREREAKEAALLKAEKLAAKLRELGIDPEKL